MAIRRSVRRRTRRAPTRSARRGGRALTMPRTIRRAIPQMRCKRTLFSGAWTFSSASVSGFWRYETITANNAINNFAEFQPLFDEYRINMVKFTYRPRYDSVESGNAGTVPQAYAHIVVDPESTITPIGTYSQGTVNTFLEQGNVRTVTLNRPFSVVYRPKTATSTGASLRYQRPAYMLTTDSATPFRGHHILLQQNNLSTANTQIILDVFVTVYFSVRNFR